LPKEKDRDSVTSEKKSADLLWKECR